MTMILPPIDHVTNIYGFISTSTVLITATPDRMVDHHALTLQMTMTSPLIGHLRALSLIPKDLLPSNLTHC